MNIPGATENVKEEIVLLPSHLHLNKEITNISHIPLLFGIIRIPDSIYRFYDRHRHRFKNKKLIKFFVKWR